MDYKLIIGGKELGVTASPPDGQGRAEVQVAGRKLSVEFRTLSPNHYHLVVAGRPVNVFVAPASEGTWVWVEGRPRLIQDPHKVKRRTSRVPGTVANEVSPPTPAEVVSVMVQVGQQVSEGQAVVVVSAMKMKMTLTAPYGGTVTAVNAKPGDQVTPGMILVEIARNPEEEDNERT